MHNNLHITLTPFRHESRVLKETDSLVRSGLVKRVYIAALHENGLKEHEKIDDNREVWRVRLRSREWSRNIVVQLIKYLELCVKVFHYARTNKIKLVNVHSLHLLPLGVFLKCICKTKLVYDTHELETETNGLCGLRQYFARYIERIFINYADLIIVVGDHINEWYRHKYGLSNIMTVLNCPKYQKPQKSKLLHYELKIPNEKKIVIYQGGLDKGRGIEQLLKAFAAVDDRNHVLVLMGCGELEPLVKKFVGAHSNIYFKEAVPPSVILKYTASADIGVSYIENTCLSYHLCLPNKFFEYIMAGIAVIVKNAPEMRRIVNENQIGIVLDEMTRQSIDQALDGLARLNPETLSNNLRRIAKSFSWENQELIMINAYRKNVFNN